ncbi:MAG TPA: hypothetical protein VM755_13530 [Stellaceae bacterium]|nr:hypothetical protein [Stellaceae bacterium]
MTDLREFLRPRHTRRTLLRGFAAILGSAPMIGAGADPAAAQQKVAPTVVGYEDHPDGGKECAKCAQFQPPDACRLVAGRISPQGSCRLFVPKSAS